MRAYFNLIFIVTILLGSGHFISAQTDYEILSTIDQQVSYYDTDFAAEYTITEYKPNQGANITKAALFRRDNANTYLILILEPEIDRGRGYLKIENRLLIYDPEERNFINTSARDRFQNTNARNSDFTQSTLAEDYSIADTKEERLGVYNTQVYTLEALHTEVTYPKTIIWVDENNLVRKFEDYSLSDQLLRTTAIPQYRQIEDRYIPVQIVIVDELLGGYVDGEFQNERTVMQVVKPTLNDLPDLIFTTAYLEQVSQ